MKIIFFDSKSYDKESFTKELVNYPDIEVKFLKTELTPFTAELAHGYDAVCAFVSADISNDTIEVLNMCGVKLILLRCAGFNNVEMETAKRFGIRVFRVPGYSPEAVAEHAMALALAVNRHLHKAYVKVRENDFSLGGLMGINFHGKTAGIIGTGKIGAAMARICHGFGMNIIAYDVFENPSIKDFVTYVTLDELLAQSDLIEKQYGNILEIGTDYNGVGKIQYLIGENQIPVLASEYTDKVRFQVLLPMSETEHFQKLLTEATNARASQEIVDSCYYAVWNGKILMGDELRG